MKDEIRFCPIAMGSEVIADRWTPMILRELVLGNTRFNDIARGLPGVSRSLLVRRLRHLEACGVVERGPAGTARDYHLTRAGQDLGEVVMALGRWSLTWLYDELRPRGIDPLTLMWWMHRRIRIEALPAGRVIVEFAFTGPERTTAWLVLSRPDVSVCVQHPGTDPDVIVRCPAPVLSGVFSGVDDWRAEVDRGTIEVLGPPRLTRTMSRWFLWSPLAPEAAVAAAG